MSGLRRSVSGAAFGHMATEVKEIKNGVVKNRGAGACDSLLRQKKNKIPSFLRKLKL